MELKYSFMLLVGAVFVFVAAAVFFIYKPGRTKFKKGIKSATSTLFKNDPIYRKKKITYMILRGILIVSIMGAIMSACVILARPYRIKKTKEEMYNRDIMICMDVSTSVNSLNYKLTKELQNTVNELSGERVGIVMFNTSPTLVAPLTDDYEFIIEQLQNIRHAIKVTEGTSYSDDWLYWNNYLFSGTLVGNEERGSSLIADGLLGAAFNFSQTDKNRTKIIIFSTDNDAYGDSYLSLKEAAELCKKENIIVYGIGTKEMTIDNMKEMQFAVESTGGKFYLEEDVGTQSSIIDDIESQSASKVKGKTIIRETEDPQLAYSILVLCFVLAAVSALLLRRADAFWIIRQVVTAALLAALLITFIIPALSSKDGQTVNVKTESNLNVLFVIDDTISMVAQDYGNDNTERLTAAKEKCESIVDELDGARFSVLSFHNSASVLSPFTNNSDHIKNVIEAISPLDEFYAKGTTLNTAKDMMLQSLAIASENKDSTNVVFFISDGEITDGSTLDSFSEISQYISGGAVMGYGTEEGGEMWVQDEYADEPEQVMDKSVYPYEPAVSKIDEDNLKSIANDMGVAYVNMNSGDSELDSIVSSLKSKIALQVVEDEEDNSNQTEYIEPEQYWGWIFAIPILLMFMFECGYVIRKR